MSMNLEEKKTFIITSFAQAAMSMGMLSDEERKRIHLSDDEIAILKGAAGMANAMVTLNGLCSLRDTLIERRESLRNDSESIFKTEL